MNVGARVGLSDKEVETVSRGRLMEQDQRGYAEDTEVWRGEWPALPVSLVAKPRRTDGFHLYL